jgi:hypothetical protein
VLPSLACSEEHGDLLLLYRPDGRNEPESSFQFALGLMLLRWRNQRIIIGYQATR